MAGMGSPPSHVAYMASTSRPTRISTSVSTLKSSSALRSAVGTTPTASSTQLPSTSIMVTATPSTCRFAASFHMSNMQPKRGLSHSKPVLEAASNFSLSDAQKVVQIVSASFVMW